MPIYTQSGRYGGGVYISEGYEYGKMYMSEKQLDVLNAVARATEGNNSLLDENQRRILLGIIEEYTLTVHRRYSDSCFTTVWQA